MARVRPPGGGEDKARRRGRQCSRLPWRSSPLQRCLDLVRRAQAAASQHSLVAAGAPFLSAFGSGCIYCSPMSRDSPLAASAAQINDDTTPSIQAIPAFVNSPRPFRVYLDVQDRRQTGPCFRSLQVGCTGPLTLAAFRPYRKGSGYGIASEVTGCLCWRISCAD